MRLLRLAGPVLLLSACAPFTTPTSLTDVNTIDHPETSGLPGLATSPFQDANLVRLKIPQALIDAEDAPYHRPAPATCPQIRIEVSTLDDALGDDFDVYDPDPIAPNAMDRDRAFANDRGLAGLRQAASGFIPFRAWIRTLSGAQRHDREVRTAIYAGRVRRAYLKGVGEALGCRFPAAPYGAPSAAMAPPEGASRR